MKRLATIALAFLAPSFAYAAAFGRDLSVGATGADVLALQKLLNRDAATQVAASGPGSPGNESSYFGPATKAAVVKFQEKYRDFVLVPSGLASGTGRVGPATRLLLEQLTMAVANTSDNSGTSPVPAAMQNGNPNFKNVDILLADIQTFATKKGYSAADIAAIDEAVLKELATTTDLRALFLSQLETTKKTAQDGYFGRFVSALNDLLGVRHAEAGLGIPFGGMIITPFYCTGSFNWMLTLKPEPPTYATLLSYYLGTEAFSWYNLPFALYVKGFYAPPGVCVIGFCPYCVHIPTWGTITPETGSSVLP